MRDLRSVIPDPRAAWVVYAPSGRVRGAMAPCVNFTTWQACGSHPAGREGGEHLCADDLGDGVVAAGFDADDAADENGSVRRSSCTTNSGSARISVVLRAELGREVLRRWSRMPGMSSS
jgi:hypothetical protein